MTAERATGLVLRVRPLTETSLIIHWLTRECGRVATVAKGARRPKSPFRGKLDLFYEADFSFQRSRRSELHTLRELGLLRTHSELREDLGRLRQAAYCALLVEQVTEVETPLPGPCQLMEELLAALCSMPARAVTVLAFESRLMAELGVGPDLSDLPLSPGAGNLLRYCGSSSFSALSSLAPTPAQVAEMAFFLNRCLVESFQRVPRGRSHAIESDRFP